MDGLVVVMFMTCFVQADECLLEDLINRCLPSACWAHTHQPMAHQLSLIQLNDIANLDRGQGKEGEEAFMEVEEHICYM